MMNNIQSIALDKLIPHPDNPNRMSKSSFAKLVRNIERTGRYEPLIVRPSAHKKNSFQIINGYHRWKALKQLGYNKADVIVWDVDDEQTDILLATLNRLGGSDVLAKKLALLKKLSSKINSRELSKLLPQSAAQINRLTGMKMPKVPAKAASENLPNPVVFFLNDKQQQIVEEALSLAAHPGDVTQTKAASKAAALTTIARHFINTTNQEHTGK